MLHWRNPGYLFVLAFALRASLWPWVLGLKLHGDEHYYWQFAKQMLVNTYANSTWPPLWPYVMSHILNYFPHIEAIRIFSAFLGSVNIVLIYYLGSRLYNRKVGFFAGLILAFFPEHILYSHYIYSELFFETFLLLATLLFFRYRIQPDQSKYLWIPFLLLGLGQLIKQSSFIPAVAFFILLMRSPQNIPIKKLIVVSLFFFLPIFIYCAETYHRKGELFPFLNTVTRNLHEYGILSGEQPAQEARTSQLVSAVHQRGARNFKKNFYNLWSPNSYGVIRLKYSHFYPFKEKRAMVFGTVIYQIGLMVLGLTGLFLTTRNDFKMFSIINLILLSSLCLAMFIVTRHRFPFMFIFIIYSAVIISEPVLYWNRIREKKRSLPLLLALGLFCHIVLTRIPYLGRWH